MTYSVRITMEAWAGSTVLDLVAELRQSGLVMNQDFEWRYQRSSYGEGNELVPASVTFEFRDPALATFYQLKWGRP